VDDHQIELDFLGKDSIRYHNVVKVTAAVYQNIKKFLKGKKEGDDLFDKLNVSCNFVFHLSFHFHCILLITFLHYTHLINIHNFYQLQVLKLNKHLSSLMPGLSAKVFRTYNASITLEKCLLEQRVVGAHLCFYCSDQKSAHCDPEQSLIQSPPPPSLIGFLFRRPTMRRW
jgi:DNA topoisomerase-1